MNDKDKLQLYRRALIEIYGASIVVDDECPRVKCPLCRLLTKIKAVLNVLQHPSL